MTAAKTGPASRDVTAELVFLTRALKAPTLRDAVPRLADRARTESWTHEEFLAACLQREVSARESHGGEGRIRAARFPARKALEDFDYDYQRSLKREVIAHLGTLDFVGARDNVVFLGPPGTGKTMLAIGLGIRACQAGHRVLFATAAEWVARLADAHHAGRLQAELLRLGRYPLLVIDEVGYIPFEPEAANLFFQLVSARYERASLIVTSNKPFGKAHMFTATCVRPQLKYHGFGGRGRAGVSGGWRCAPPDRRPGSSRPRICSAALRLVGLEEKAAVSASKMMSSVRRVIGPA